MDIVALLNALALQIESLKAALGDAQAAADALKKEAYDQGYADGVAAQKLPDDLTPFSQADLDKAVAEAIAPLKEKIEAIPAMIDAAKADAIAMFKAELAAKYAELQVVEQAAETGFAELLK